MLPADIKNLTRKQLTEAIQRQVQQLGLTPPAPQVPAPAPTPSLIDDEVGQIFLVKLPIEGCDVSHMVDTTSIMDFNDKFKSGELTSESISAICKSSASANRKATKLLQEFNKNLVKSRKSELKELRKKKTYFEAQISATEDRFKDETMIDESRKVKLSKIRRGIKTLDKRIIDLENQLKVTKEEDTVE